MTLLIRFKSLAAASGDETTKSFTIGDDDVKVWSDYLRCHATTLFFASSLALGNKKPSVRPKQVIVVRDVQRACTITLLNESHCITDPFSLSL
jgi:hypothetical protein